MNQVEKAKPEIFMMTPVLVWLASLDRRRKIRYGIDYKDGGLIPI